MSSTSILDGYFSLLHLGSGLVTLIDQLQIRAMGNQPIPPLHLRHRVHGTPELSGFLQVGARSAQDIVNAVRMVDRNPADFTNVLDFGCGCGRTLPWLRRWLVNANIHGTDIDPELIAWDQKNLPGITFGVNAPEPPLAYTDGQFDLVYAVSVFTHLNQTHQDLWLAELARITMPGALVLVTLHGAEITQTLAPQAVEEVEAEGLAFVPSAYWHGVFPDWYQNTYHSQAYVRSHFDQYFEVLKYLPKGLNDSHDLVVMRKRDGAAPVSAQ